MLCCTLCHGTSLGSNDDDIFLYNLSLPVFIFLILSTTRNTVYLNYAKQTVFHSSAGTAIIGNKALCMCVCVCLCVLVRFS